MLAMFKQAWKGETSLGTAFWLVYLVMGALLSFLIGYIVQSVSPNSDYYFARSLTTTIALPYTLFSAVCVWRCGKNSWIVWNVLTKVIVSLSVIFSILTVFYLLGII
jgi:hypothetical protein